MSKIYLKNISLKLLLYHDNSPSLKSIFTNILSKKKKVNTSEFLAINNISLEINDTERVGIIGHNGAGKSSLLKIIAKIYETEIGEIKIEGQITPLIEIGAGFQPEFSGRENIYINGEICGIKTKELKELEEVIIEFSGIRDFIDTPLKYYSSGMVARLAFSIAIHITSDILLLDEVFAVGDLNFLEKAKKKIEEKINQASIVIMSSHSLELIENFMDRCIWLDHGSIKMDGPSKNVVQAYKKYYNSKSK